MIVLTGATGALGSQVLDSLLRLVPPNTLRVSTQDPSRLPDHVGSSGAEIVKASYSDLASLDIAFADAETVLLVSYPSIAHEERVRMHVAAIDAAKRANVQHVFYTSLAFDPAGSAAVFSAHRDTEAYLKESGLKYTIIREGIYSESYPLYFGFFQPASNQSDVYVPGDGDVAWVNRPDLGEGTAKLLVDKDRYINQTVLLSGSQPISLSKVSELISTHLGRPIRLHVVPVDEWIAKHKKSGGDYRSSEEFLRLWATTYPALEAGECAVVDPLLETLLGRPPTPFEVDLKISLQAATEGSGVLDKYAN